MEKGKQLRGREEVLGKETETRPPEDRERKKEGKENVERREMGGHWKTRGRGVVRTSRTGRVRFGVGEEGRKRQGHGRREVVSKT